MQNPEKKRILRVHRGVVVGDAMAKTIVVKVTRSVWHPKYHRQYRTSQRYKVHDEKNAYHVGDTVEFVETRPISKDKHWKVLRKLER